jgi:hypothetical protein
MGDSSLEPRVRVEPRVTQRGEPVESRHDERYPDSHEDRGLGRYDGRRPDRCEPRTMSMNRSPDRLDDGDYFRDGPPRSNDRQARSNRRALEPETYDGKTSVETYLEGFERVADWNNWSYQERAMMLGMSLRGSAKAVMAMLPRQAQDDYPSVWRHLVKYFGQKNDVLVMQERFWQRVRKVNEPITEYASDLQLLGHKAFQGMIKLGDNRQYESMLVNRFVAGIGDFELGRHIHLQQPDTLNEAVALAQQFLAYDQIGRRSLPYPKPKSNVHVVQGDGWQESPSSYDDKTVSDLRKDVNMVVSDMRELKLEMKNLKEMISNGSQHGQQGNSTYKPTQNQYQRYNQNQGRANSQRKYQANSHRGGSAPVHNVSNKPKETNVQYQKGRSQNDSGHSSQSDRNTAERVRQETNLN